MEKEEAPKCTSFVFWMVLAEVRGGAGTIIPVINLPVPFVFLGDIEWKKLEAEGGWLNGSAWIQLSWAV